MTTDLFLGGLAVLVMAAIVIVFMTRSGQTIPSDNKNNNIRVQKGRSQRDSKG